MFERWVKTYEKILDWEWGDDPYIFTFFVKLTLLVNVSTKRWHGRTIKRGQLLTSMRHLEDKFGWSHHTIQRVLEALQTTGEITVESNKEGTLITVVNYAKYQGEGVANTATPSATPSATQPATQPATPSATQPATNIRNIECKKEEEKNINPLPHARAREIGIEAFGSFSNVFLFPAEHRTLVENYSQDLTDKAIEDLSCKIAEGDEQALNSRNHYATLDRWLRYKRDTSRVLLDSSQPQPSETNEEFIIRIAWQALTDKEKKDYMDTHGGKTLIETKGAI